jgi:uncharacterized conserved protein, contains FHA domain
MHKSSFRVIRDSQSLEYIFDSDNSISMTEFKVVQGLSECGILCGVKAFHNGNDKLIFDISGFNSLSGVISVKEASEIKNISDKIMRIIEEIKNSGFLQAEHLDWNLDRIFVDKKFENVYMIYIPAEIGQNEPWELKCSQMMKEIYEIKPELEHSQAETAKPLTEEISDEDDKNSNENISGKSKKGLFKKFFKDKQSKEKKYKKEAVEESFGGTELLDSIFIPSIVISGVNTPQKIEAVVSKEEYVIGKNPDCTDLTVDFSKAVSNRHCCIICKDGISYIKDLTSTNGTFLNGVRVLNDDQKQIKVGDKIRIANCEFVVKSV